MLDSVVNSPDLLARRALPDKDAYFATIPVGRWGRPEEVGWAAVYLASDEAAFVTGQTIPVPVNGGHTCR